jgi:hypothetical protein
LTKKKLCERSHLATTKVEIEQFFL